MIPRLKADLGLSEIVKALKFWGKDSVSVFEAEFAELMGQSQAVAFPYGRSGLVTLLQAFGMQGKEIICPAYTCVVVPHAISTAGCEPVFIDSSVSNFNMDWELVDAAITENTGAVIATSIFGHAVDLDAVKSFRQKYPNIRILQDCAHSFAASWNGEAVQLVGDAAFFGMNISKVITAIFGGMVTTDSLELADKLREIRETEFSRPKFTKSVARFAYLVAVVIAFNRNVYGLVNYVERKGLLNRFVKYYDPALIDMPVDYLENLTPLEARVGIVQCRKYEDIVEHRRRVSAIYFRELQDCPNLLLPVQIEGSTYSHFTVRVDSASEIIEYCRLAGFQLGELIDYYIPSMPTYKSHRCLSKGISETWPGNVINLPVHCGVNMNDAVRLTTTIKLFFTNPSR